VGRKKVGNLTLKKYLVAIPVPCLDRNGRKLMRGRVKEWVRMAERELTECFGGATPIPSSGTNVIDGKILYETGQMLVYSTCDSRTDFLKKRNRIQAFVERMGRDLDQESVFVLACPSDSFLIEIEMRSRLK
jgi:hypothetical protein